MRFLTILIYLFTISGVATAEPIKMSDNLICHTIKSAYYEQTKKYTLYPSLDDCIKAGGRLPKIRFTGSPSNEYKREYFGDGWRDDDDDCKDTRAEILVANSTVDVSYSDVKQCRIKHGHWISSFTGARYYSASELDIDHVVPLKWAWENGASTWSDALRTKFANDPSNLLPVEASLNRQKGAQDISQWLPPRNQCAYISRFMRVIKTYPFEISEKKMISFNAILTQHCRTK